MMRHFFLLSLSALFLFSCDSSDDKCNIDDWLGTYRGVKTCDSEVEDDYVFSVTRDDLNVTNSDVPDQVFLIIDEQRFSFNPQNCQVFGGQSLTVDIADTTTSSWKDGELRITIDYALGGSCSWVADKI